VWKKLLEIEKDLSDLLAEYEEKPTFQNKIRVETGLLAWQDAFCEFKGLPYNKWPHRMPPNP
jgi:hypothetical protein